MVEDSGGEVIYSTMRYPAIKKKDQAFGRLLCKAPKKNVAKNERKSHGPPGFSQPPPYILMTVLELADSYQRLACHFDVCSFTDVRVSRSIW